MHSLVNVLRYAHLSTGVGGGVTSDCTAGAAAAAAAAGVNGRGGGSGGGAATAAADGRSSSGSGAVEEKHQLLTEDGMALLRVRIGCLKLGLGGWFFEGGTLPECSVLTHSFHTQHLSNHPSPDS